MDWIYSQTQPEKVETRNHLGQTQKTINFDIEEIPEDESGNRWRYHSVTLSPGVWSYEAIVAALIKFHFTDDEREAIINNYLADPEGKVARAEMEELQQWRKEAKQIARNIFFLA